MERGAAEEQGRSYVAWSLASEFGDSNAFRSGDFPVIVSTNIDHVGSGVQNRQIIYIISTCAELDDLRYIINYDCPSPRDYIYRYLCWSSYGLWNVFPLSFALYCRMTSLARDGWEGHDGTSVTFMTYNDAGKAQEMLQILRTSEQVHTNDGRTNT